jgi:hypothetical protein
VGECDLMNPTMVVGQLVVNKTPAHHKVDKLLENFSENAHGRSLYYQVENHVRTKFATPILYAMDILKNYIYITIDNIFCIYF